MPEPSIRADLERLRPTPDGANAGLWLDRFLREQLVDGEKPTGKLHPHSEHIKSATRIGEPAAYARFFARWQEALNALSQYEQVKQGEATARGRVVVGLGAEGVLENAITLHRAYGVPYIPGSALKGVAAAYAHRRLCDPNWRKEVRTSKGELVTPLGEAHKLVFGDTTSAGYVTFFDALYIPGTARGGHLLLPDVLTVHHPDYYQSEGNPKPPTDWDSPTPIAFVSTTGCFLVAVAGPAALVPIAYDLLALALHELGVGGKTAAGYGRLTLKGLAQAQARLGDALDVDTEPKPDPQLSDDPEASVANALIAHINNLPEGRVASEINRFYQEAKRITIGPAHRARVAQAIIAKVRAAGREKASAGKPWYQEVLEWQSQG